MIETRRTKQVFVIGAHGVFGAQTVRAFRAAGWAVRAGARRPGTGETEIDLDRPDSVALALRPEELVVNTVPHPELLAERQVLERGGILINVSTLPAAASRALRAVAGAARGTVLMNAGLAPGVTTLVAADALRHNPEARELEIVFTVSVTSPRGPADAAFIHRGLTALTQHRTAVVPLPSPFGDSCCLGFGEGDAGWLGGIAEGRVVRQYICVAEPQVQHRLLELNRAGAISGLPRSAVSPGHPPGSREPVAHWIAALRDGRRLCARTVECRGAVLHSARSTVVFADALLSRTPPRGCFDPEEICTLNEIEAGLRAAGITVVTHEHRVLEH